MTATANFVVYELLNLDGELLYVGVTRNLEQRLAAHRHSAPWYHEVGRVQSHAFDTADEAASAEGEYIKGRTPRYNRERAGKSGVAWKARVAEKVATIRVPVRLPLELHAALVEWAAEDSQSLESQIVTLLGQIAASRPRKPPATDAAGGRG